MSLLIYLSIPSILAVAGMAVIITSQTLYPRLRAQYRQVRASGAMADEQPVDRESGSARAA